MCFTGGYALAMMTESSVVAPVLSQPSMPIALGSKARAAGLDVTPAEAACAKARFAAEDLSMIGLRFRSDTLVPDARVGVGHAQLSDEALEQVMLAFMEGKIARWWMPDDVAFVEEIPHTATGKIQKMSLRDMFRDYRLPTA